MSPWRKHVGQVLWHVVHVFALGFWTYVAVMASWGEYPRIFVGAGAILVLCHFLILVFSEGVWR